MKWRRRAGGEDCRVGHVCDVSGLTSWLHQQVVHIGSSGRAAKHPCHVSLLSWREEAATVHQDSLQSDFAQPVLLRAGWVIHKPISSRIQVLCHCIFGCQNPPPPSFLFFFLVPFNAFPCSFIFLYSDANLDTCIQLCVCVCGRDLFKAAVTAEPMSCVQLCIIPAAVKIKSDSAVN